MSTRNLALPLVQVPLPFLPAFAGLQKIGIVYFHRLQLRRESGSVLRVIAVTSSGELGLFHIDGNRKGSARMRTDVLGIMYNNRYVVLEVTPGVDLDDDATKITLDFDTSSANVRGNETTDNAIKRFLQVCAHFMPKGAKIFREGADKVSKKDDGPAVVTDRGNADVSQAPLATPPSDPSLKRNSMTSFSSLSNRKKANSTFSKLFSGFSGVWNRDNNPLLENNGPDSAASLGRGGDDDDGLYSPGGGGGANKNNRDSTVSVETHDRQRKRVHRWHDEILSRFSERDGLDQKERVLDDLGRLEGALKKQQALIEAPKGPSPEEELEQQRNLASLVMFVCRRQSMLAEAKATQIPEVRPKSVAAEASVPNSVPVLPSYVDAFRSQILV